MASQGRAYHRRRDALAALHGFGAHMILCDGKVPLPGFAWRDRRRTLDEITDHSGQIGIRPASLGATVADVDTGDAANLPEPFCSYSTPSGGKHCWYGDPVPRANARWNAGGAAGDIRSGSGYVVAWGDAPELIRDGLESRNLYLFDPELFRCAPRPGREPLPAPETGPPAATLEDLIGDHDCDMASFFEDDPAITAAHAERLSATYPRSRHTTLFEVLTERCHAIRADGGTLSRRELATYARDCNQAMPHPLGSMVGDAAGELVATVEKIFDWWREVSWDSATQRERALRQGAQRRKSIAGRDAEIAHAVLVAGESRRSVAARYGLSEGTVRKTLNRVPEGAYRAVL